MTTRFLFLKQLQFGLAIACLLSAALVSRPLTARSCNTIQSQEDSISVHCGGAPSATVDQNGRLWVVFVQDQHVYISYSDDLGKNYSQAVLINKEAEDIEYNGENRPKIIVDGESNIYVSWTWKTSPRFTGEIRFSRSLDGGRSFETPRTINDDELFTGHRFESLFLTDSGHLYLTWIDKRDLLANTEQGKHYPGAAVYYAVSSDQGESFSNNYRVANNSCECCRIAVAPRGPENIAIFWRQIFGEDTRDHAIAVLTPAGQILDMNRASYDEWHIDACPHHGPSMVQSSISGDYHLSWFSNGELHQGIYYSRYSFDSKMPEDVYLVDGSAGASHPYLAEYDRTLYLVWKAFDGQKSLINLIKSSNDGKSWSQPETLLSTVQGSDHPLIVKTSTGLFLSWLSEEKGYTFDKITSPPVRVGSGE